MFRHLAGSARLVATLMVLLLVATGCTLSVPGVPVDDHPCGGMPEAHRAIDGLYVLPDDGRAPIVEEIDAARCTIEVTIYLISDVEVIDALGRAQARGVDVRVLLEETPFGGFGQVDTAELLRSRGIDVKSGLDRFTFTHAKYLVIDGAAGVITNQNLTTSSFASNREFGVITTDPVVVQSLTALFEADWNRTEPPEMADRLIVSPINARETLTSLLHDATESIALYVEVIRDDDIVRELRQAAARGVEVRLIVNPPADELDVTVLGALLDGGVDIRVSGHLYVHAKALLIDHDIAVIGSHNPTSTSLDENREVSLLVADPIALERLDAMFEHDWSAGAPWRAGNASFGLDYQNRSIVPLALDMPIVYGYCVRTVPMGLTRISW